MPAPLIASTSRWWSPPRPFGAIVGDNLGFWIGRRFGHNLLVHYGYFIGIDDAKLKLGPVSLRRHGGKVVFFGRFVAVLRAGAALLAGVNCMPWDRFLFFNAAGGVVWAALFGCGGFFLGQEFQRLHGSFADWRPGRRRRGLGCRVAVHPAAPRGAAGGTRALPGRQLDSRIDPPPH